MIYDRSHFMKPVSLSNFSANSNRAIRGQHIRVQQTAVLSGGVFSGDSPDVSLKTRLKGRLATPLKIAACAAVIALSMADTAWAGLDEQVEKANALILGNVATMILGGGVVFGGAMAAIKGNLMQAMAIIGTGGIIGIGAALAKGGQIFSLLN